MVGTRSKNRESADENAKNITSKKTKNSKKPTRKNTEEAKKTTRKKARVYTYNTYIRRLGKSIKKGNVRFSKKSMLTMDTMVNDIIERIVTEADKIAQNNKKKTVTTNEIQSAVRIVLPGELARQAVSEGTKAVKKLE